MRNIKTVSEEIQGNFVFAAVILTERVNYIFERSSGYINTLAVRNINTINLTTGNILESYIIIYYYLYDFVGMRYLMKVLTVFFRCRPNGSELI